MKVLATLLLIMSFGTMATPPTAKMDITPSGIEIVFSDYENATGFENYTCNVDFGTWAYKLASTKVVVNGETKYRCLDQGGLSPNQYYNVWFTFEDRPSMYKTESPLFRLQAN